MTRKYSQNWREVNILTSVALQIANSIGFAAMEWDNGCLPSVTAIAALKRHHESLGLLIKDMERS
jgi:hypothetical protein